MICKVVCGTRNVSRFSRVPELSEWPGSVEWMWMAGDVCNDGLWFGRPKHMANFKKRVMCHVSCVLWVVSFNLFADTQ